MKVNVLIDLLKTMPQDAEVFAVAMNSVYSDQDWEYSLSMESLTEEDIDYLADLNIVEMGRW